SLVHAESYFRNFCWDLLRQGHVSGGTEVDLQVEAGDLMLPGSLVLTMAQILGELLTNSLKHAFRNRDSGRISVSLRSSREELNLEVLDDGLGFAELTEGLGLCIARSLTGQLHGRLSLSSGTGTGTRATFVIPLCPE
ncbi:MAG TPA: ATP-binding protein, partial [Rectinemataceae bacterium]|nr:ATP-binding protein [Rectinemataceae bacterium]